MTPYEPGYLTKLKEKHPYPGGWRTGPTERDWETWRGLVEKYRNWKPWCKEWGRPFVRWSGSPGNGYSDPSILDLGCAVDAVPDGRMDDFDITDYVVKVTWKLPAPIDEISQPLRRRQATILVDGEEFSRIGVLFRLRWNSYDAAWHFMMVNPQIRRIKREGGMYYSVNDVRSALRQQGSTVKQTA